MRSKVGQGRSAVGLGTLILVLALVRPASALAKGEDEMRGYLLSVNRLYEDLEYERALSQIERAKAVARTTDESVTLALYEGVILADMNRWAESSGAFKEALFLRPEAKLPLKVSPKVAQHFEKVRESVKKELAPTAAAPPASAPKPAPAVPEVKPAPKAEVTPLPKAEVKPEAKAEVKPAPKAEVKPEPKTEVKPAPKAEVKPENPERTRVPAETRPGTSLATAESGLLRPRVLVPAIAGGVLLVAGGTSLGMSRRELSRFTSNDQALDTPSEVRSTASRGRTLQTVGVGLLSAGAMSLGLAAGMYFAGAPSGEGTLAVGTDGTSAFIIGRWP